MTSRVSREAPAVAAAALVLRRRPALQHFGEDRLLALGGVDPPAWKIPGLVDRINPMRLGVTVPTSECVSAWHRPLL